MYVVQIGTIIVEARKLVVVAEYLVLLMNTATTQYMNMTIILRIMLYPIEWTTKQIVFEQGPQETTSLSFLCKFFPKHSTHCAIQIYIITDRTDVSIF